MFYEFDVLFLVFLQGHFHLLPLSRFRRLYVFGLAKVFDLAKEITLVHVDPGGDQFFAAFFVFFLNLLFLCLVLIRM